MCRMSVSYIVMLHNCIKTMKLVRNSNLGLGTNFETAYNYIDCAIV